MDSPLITCFSLSITGCCLVQEQYWFVNADSCSSFIPSFILLYLGTAGLHGNNIFRLFLEGHFLGTTIASCCNSWSLSFDYQMSIAVTGPLLWNSYYLPVDSFGKKDKQPKLSPSTWIRLIMARWQSFVSLSTTWLTLAPAHAFHDQAWRCNNFPVQARRLFQWNGTT